MRTFLQSVFVQLLLNPYVFLRGWQAIPPKKVWRIPFIVCFAVELCAFFVGFFFHGELPDKVMRIIRYYCETWYIGLLYVTMALLAIGAIRRTYRRMHGRYPRWVMKYGAQTKLALFFFVIAGVSALLWKAYNTVMHPLVRHVYVTLPKTMDGGVDSLRVVMMSDLHIGDFIGKEMVQRYVSLSNAQHPDLVVLVGDWLDYESRTAEREHIEEDLQQLRAPKGVYAVNGNHEYRANRHAKRKWIGKTGATLLVDSVVCLPGAFYLVGRDDFINRKRQPLHSLLKPLRGDLPVVVLDHQPYSLAETAMNQADLCLCGHTHNGQLWPYSLLMKWIYECPYGYYRKGNTQFYVSSGIGVAGAPFRVGTVSELVVLHILFAGKSFPVAAHNRETRFGRLS
ncbi:MAG: metallophosphoesterase [Tannerellaceae bacterium]|nr:metallophosphoesterase [Tannerellaceae bacterium]